MENLAKIATSSKASQGSIELAWLLETVSVIKPKFIVEIGVHQGYSLETWQKAFRPTLLVGIDNDLHALKWDKANIIEADSHDHKTGEVLVDMLFGNEIDFLFIDGDHMYEGVKQDFEMYAPLVRKGGIIAFDDMNLFDNPSVEVHQFWQQVVSRWPDQTEWLQDDSNGIGILHI